MENDKILRLCVLATSLTQVISPAISSFSGGNDDSTNSNTQITPAGYTFAIWGIITLLSAIYGIYQYLPLRKNKELHLKIAPRLILIYVLFSSWLFAAQKDWLIITVIIFVTMFWNLRKVFEIIIPNKNQLLPIEKIILEGQIGLYFGWSTIAIFANLGSAIKFYGVSDTGVSGIIWQTVLLSGALINAVIGAYKFRLNAFYIGTIFWAFLGILIGLNDEMDRISLQIITSILIVVFVAFLWKFMKQLFPKTQS
jgi:hypothetical protein